MTNNTTFPGTLTCPTSSVSNAMTMGTTKTYVVTVSNASGANKYYIDGYLQASLVLHQGQTYIFDLSSSTLSGHPFEFSTTNNGSHGGGSAYSTGITTTGTYADDQTRTFVVSTSTPTTLYYYCTAHSGMGGSVTISPKAELIVSGGAEFIGTGTIKLPSGTTSERPTTGVVGMIRYNTTTGYMESYTNAGWGSIASPPVVTNVSPVSVLGADTATQVFTVTGTGFDANFTIKLVGADGTEYSVFSTTYVSALSATFKMGALGATNGYDAAQRPFKVKVIGGSGLSSTLESPTITIPAPTITGVSPTTLAYTAVGSQTITVTGTNFTSSMASGNNIQVLGADGSTLYNVDSAAVASATSITFKLAATGGSLSSGQLANRPYKVKVTGGGGLTATSTQTIGFTGISWTSPASGATLGYTNGSSGSTSLVATDDVGGTNVTFSITAGSVGGLSLGSASASPATYSGTASSLGTTNVTFRVTDNVTGTTADRTFSIEVVDPPLFTWNGANETIQTKAKWGQFYTPSVGPWIAPTITELRSIYAPASTGGWENNTAYYNVVNTGVQVWTVPETGTWRIKAYGARGGASVTSSSGNTLMGALPGGTGGIVQGDVALTRGQKLMMVVGSTTAYNSNRPNMSQYSDQAVNGHSFALQRSPRFTGWRSGAGGGGTFVALQYDSTSVSPGQALPLIIAGGGGGMEADWSTSVPSRSAGGYTHEAESNATWDGAPSQRSGNGGAGGAGYYHNAINTPTGGQKFTSGDMSGGRPPDYGQWGTFGGGGHSGGNIGGGGGGASGGNIGTYANGQTGSGQENIPGDGGTDYTATNVVSNIVISSGNSTGWGAGIQVGVEVNGKVELNLL